MKINDIEAALHNLAERRPLFWSEADFQFELAWELHKLLGESAKIYLERRYEPNKSESSNTTTLSKILEKYYVDIWIEYNDAIYPIELKYTTKECWLEGDNYADCVHTKDQAAIDIGAYRFLWDIKRLEDIKECHKGVKHGYAIMLTCDAKYYKEPKNKRETIFDNFRLTNGRKIASNTSLSWKIASQLKDHWTEKWPPFNLKNEYQLSWKRYGKDIKAQCSSGAVELKYLIIEV